MASQDFVYVIAEFLPVQNQEKKLFELLNHIAFLTLKNEKNCLKYVVTKQINHPGTSGQSLYKIVSIEEFKNTESFDQHCQAPYVRDFVAQYMQADREIIQDFNVRLFKSQ